MPASGNENSSLADNGEADDDRQQDEEESHHSSQPAENDDESSGEQIDCHTPDKDDDDNTSDPIVVSPGPASPSTESDESDAEPSSPDEEESSSLDKKNGTITKALFQEETTTPPNLSFVTAGFQRKATPWAIKSWAALVLTLDGRDKITKVLQYSCRLLGWWLAGGSGGGRGGAFNKHAAARFTMIYKSLGSSRKAFRLGRSFIEFDKLRSMGLVGLIFWHLEQNLMDVDDDDSQRERHPKPKTVQRRASSNIGWGPSTLEDEAYESSSLRSRGSSTYKKMYRPLLSRLSSTLASTETPTMELWKALGSAFKMLGLLGFWAGDNLNFVLSTGALDDMSVPTNERLAKRSSWQSICGIRTNQAYFGGSLAGLLVNWYTYIKFRRETLANAEDQVQEATSPEDGERMILHLKKTKEKQFSLFLALLKSCCDVMVFSNMPGIDLHKRFRGKKNHEGFHCVCGLISASTVIYNNFPDAHQNTL